VTGERPGRVVYEEFIQEQLETEEKRKTSLESRGLSVVTTSGALVTLLFAIAAIETTREGFVLPADSRPLLISAGVFFIVAAVLALLTNLPLPYSNARPEELQLAIRKMWDDAEREATQMTSATRVAFLKRAQFINQLKGYVLLLALVAEVTAVGLLFWTVARILSTDQTPTA
jgi:hypothetical protein